MQYVLEVTTRGTTREATEYAGNYNWCGEGNTYTRSEQGKEGKLGNWHAQHYKVCNWCKWWVVC